ncbi:MAG: hypothetical protein RLY71_1990 [Pseudomonadota bacterium]|jgi:predicted DNA-binding transcriptional regulator AlpA
MNTDAQKHPPIIPDDLAALALLDIKQVCSLVGLSASNVRQRINAGTFPPPDLIDGMRCTRWAAGTVRQWLQHKLSEPKPAGLDEAMKTRATTAYAARMAKQAAGLALVKSAVPAAADHVLEAAATAVAACPRASR